MTKNSIYLSKYIHFFKLNDNSYIVWNRFSPSILGINSAGKQFLDSLRHGSYKYCKSDNDMLDLFLTHKIILNEPTDSSKEHFFNSMSDKIAMVKDYANALVEDKKPYTCLTLGNNKCNLSCNYCVKKHSDFPNKILPFDVRLGITNKVVDQYFSRHAVNSDVIISFNGGEILLEWPLIKKVIDRIDNIYTNYKVDYRINTNMTLVKGEIAQYLKNHNFDISISIDGYEEHNDRTRIYHDRKGTFNDIIENVKEYRKLLNDSNAIDDFQGTIDNVTNFNPEMVYDMNGYGFKGARLAPNLLKITKKDAHNKAKIMRRIFALNKLHENSTGFSVSDINVRNFINLVNMENYDYFFSCVGLSLYPDYSLSFNIDTMAVSLLCCYVKKAFLTIDTKNVDIYSNEIWEKAEAFIQERAVAIKKYCSGCSLVGICKGSCIYSGLDHENNKNNSACLYQRKVWGYFLKNSFT